MKKRFTFEKKELRDWPTIEAKIREFVADGIKITAVNTGKTKVTLVGEADRNTFITQKRRTSQRQYIKKWPHRSFRGKGRVLNVMRNEHGQYVGAINGEKIFILMSFNPRLIRHAIIAHRVKWVNEEDVAMFGYGRAVSVQMYLKDLRAVEKKKPIVDAPEVE